MQNFTYLKFDRRNDTSLLGLFVEADELYYIEPAGTDWRFGYTSRRSGATVTMTVGESALLSGADILQALNAAMALGDDANLNQALVNAGLPDNPMKRAFWMQPTVPDGDAMAYRTYLSTRDLERLLSFPSQPSTSTFRRVIFVEATVAALPSSGLVQPDAAPSWRYMVVYPEGVKVSVRSSVDFGERLTITYSAPERESASHHVTAGKPSPFVSYYGAAICVQPLSRLGIELKPIETPAAKEPEEAPRGRRVNIVMRFTDDRTLQSTIYLDPQSSEYSLLRSGTWHGYRARRMVVKTHGDESYLVDLRPADPGEASQAVANGPELPEQYGASGLGRQRRLRTSPWLYACAALLAVILGVVVVSYLPSLMPKGNPDYAPGTVDSVAVVAEEQLLGIQSDSTVLPTPSDSIIAPAEVPASSPETSVTSAGSIDAADIAYLNSHTVWVKSELKSVDAQSLFDLLSTGNLKEIVSNPYMSDRKCGNATAVKIAQLLWQAYGADTQQSNQRVLKQLTGKDKIDLTDLHEKLARVRPTNPNKSERP